MTEESTVWEVRLAIFSTKQQVEEIKTRITRLLCPDPDHTPPCPVPWSIFVLHGSDLDDPDVHSTLIDQARIENDLTADTT